MMSIPGSDGWWVAFKYFLRNDKASLISLVCMRDELKIILALERTCLLL